MGLSYSSAKWIAPASFIYDFASQQYGMLSTPNMLDIHNRYISYFSPQPYFIGGFFAPQQVLQLVWLYRLWSLSNKADADRSLADTQELKTIVDYVPWYALGNVCIGTWLFFWNAEDMKSANVLVTINTLSQLFYVATKLGPLNMNSRSSVLTHIVSKTFAGIGVLDLLHNTSAAYAPGQQATTVAKVLTGVSFGLASSMSDWIFGGCLVYDLVAVAVGQSVYAKGTNWSMLLSLYAAGAAGIVAVRNFAK